MEKYVKCTKCQGTMREYVLVHYFGGVCPTCGSAEHLLPLSIAERKQMLKDLNELPPQPPRLSTKEWNERKCSIEGCIHPPEFRAFIIDQNDKNKMVEKMYCLKHGEEELKKLKSDN